MEFKRLLLVKPSITETCVWRELFEVIYPAKCARLHLYIGKFRLKFFQFIRRKIVAKSTRVENESTKTRKRKDHMARTPLISIGPSGIGGDYQEETYS